MIIMLGKTFIYSIVTAAIMAGGGHVPRINVEATIEKARPLFQKDTLTMCVMGDLMMHSKQLDAALQADGTYDFSPYFKLIEDRITAADLAIGNLEVTLAGKPYTGYPSFSAPESFARYLAACGFDVFLCANNHILDRGSRGASLTMEKLHRLDTLNSVKFCGIASSPKDRDSVLFIRRKGISVALLNFTYGTNHDPDKEWPMVNRLDDTTHVKKMLERSQLADFTIALPHWGIEYQLKPSSRQKSMAQLFADNGADLIIGSHPHVLQGYEILRPGNVQVAYSLGNAVSNMSAKNTQLELLATVRIALEENGDIKLLPLKFTYLWCSRPGGFSDSYTVIPVKDYEGKAALWTDRSDYDNMMSTYKRVKDIINIEDE